MKRLRFRLLILILALLPGLATHAAGPRVVVLPFEMFNAPDVEALSPGLQSMLASRLAAPVYSVTVSSDSENRAVGRHSHASGDPGHSHSINDPGHSHYTSSVLRQGGSRSDENGGPYFASASSGAYSDRRGTGISVNGSPTHISINAAGSTDGTNAPFVQLLVCERD